MQRLKLAYVNTGTLSTLCITPPQAQRGAVSPSAMERTIDQLQWGLGQDHRTLSRASVR